MLNIKNLELGFSDAENYKRRENKNLLNELFIKNDALDKLCKPSTTFLVGDKGTGKTAYAVYMTNNSYKGNRCSLRFIRETEYRKFISLKKERHLDLSDYSSIWKVIIYILILEQIYEGEQNNSLFKKFTKLHKLHKIINEYYEGAFSPEIITAFKFAQDAKVTAKLISSDAELGGSMGYENISEKSKFQINLLYIQRKLEYALSSLSLQNNHIIFIDGIDVRSSSIPYEDYLDCIKGLAHAVWEINNDFFPSIRDSKGRLRAVLLVRPDIFASLRLQNQNTKIRDNSVLLEWITTYKAHRSSDLFFAADQLLSYQQPNKDNLTPGEAWDHYFPYNTPNISEDINGVTSFISFLRFAYYRPRDIVTMIRMIKDEFIKENRTGGSKFSLEDFVNTTFRRNYADYLLGEVKDQLSFYYSDDDYENFLKFFEYFDGSVKFNYSQFLTSFHQIRSHMDEIGKEAPKFMSTPDEFLQFLFELNVICYIERTEEDKPFIHWCFRERSYSNISPKVKFGLEYEIFYGMAKALNSGSKFKTQHNRQSGRQVA